MPAVTNTMATPLRPRFAQPYSAPVTASNLPCDPFARVRPGVRPLRYIEAKVNGRPVTYTSHTVFHAQVAPPPEPGGEPRFRTLASYVGDLGQACACYVAGKPTRTANPRHKYRLVMVSPAGKQTVIAGYGVEL